MKEIKITWKPEDKKKVKDYASALGISLNKFVNDTMIQVLGNEKKGKKKCT